MRPRALLVSLPLAFATAVAAAADDGVVARVQDASVTASELTRRLGTLGPAQLDALSKNPSEIPRKFVETTLAFELAASLEAKQRGLEKSEAFLDRERVVLKQALEASLKTQALSEKPVSADEIKTYYEANKDRFQQPLGVRVWRILLDDEAAAKRILEQVQGSSSPAKWSELARDNSVDKATNLRQGDLGFVHADGATDVPRVRVDAALFAAAKGVKDGEVVPHPVREGQKFAVVWRRGSRPERSRTLEQERDSIRALLERERAEQARAALVSELRTKAVKEEHPELLDQLPEGVFGSKLARPRPALVAPRQLSPTGLRPPEPGDRGLR